MIFMPGENVYSWMKHLDKLKDGRKGMFVLQVLFVGEGNAARRHGDATCIQATLKCKNQRAFSEFLKST